MYDNDKYGLNQTAVLRLPFTTNAAAEIVARVQFFTKTKITEMRTVVVSTAGFDEADVQFDIYKDTASIGSIDVGPGTVNTVTDASLADTIFESTNSMEIHQASETATCVVDLIIQYQEAFE